MSPEQTGRMNRPIDYRSDIYSFGVTMYHVMTGSKPFDSPDPLELIHLHVTKKPIPPHERTPGFPLAVSNIIMKCLEKNVEDRYQSCFGIAYDLQQCIDSLSINGEVAHFPLQEKDFSPKFRIPNKLYGRQDDVKKLVNAFGQMCTEQRSKLLIISGFSGIGKTSLVNELQRPIVASKGYSISGKFDQFRRNVPYSAIIAAFSGLVRYLLFEKQDIIDRLRTAITDTVAPYGQVLVQILPEIEKIIGKQPDLPELSSLERRELPSKVIHRLLDVLATQDHPLVIFIDDLQWADLPSLSLFESLFASNHRCLLMIAAYRSNEVSEAHPLNSMIKNIQKNAIIDFIGLQPLNFDHTLELVADTLRESKSSTEALADIIYRKTASNPFFINQMLLRLYAQKLFRVDFDAQKWVWSLEEIKAHRISDKVVDVMIEKLSGLPQKNQYVLQVAAILGNRFSSAHVASLIDKTQEEVSLLLEKAEQDGLVIKLDEDYKFEHDKIQEAAYQSIRPDMKADLHYRVSKKLIELANTPGKHEKYLFDIANHLNKASSRLLSEQEKDLLVTFNLEAGIVAKDATAYVSALAFLQIADQMVTPARWKTSYEQSKEIRKHLIECMYMTGDTVGVEKVLEATFQELKAEIDKVELLIFKLRALASANKLDECIDIGLDCVKRLGVNIQRKPSSLRVLGNLVKVKMLLVGKKKRHILRLPDCEDKTVKVILGVLIDIVSSSFILGESNLYAVIGVKLMQLTLKHGHSSQGSYALANYALFCNGVFENYRDSVEFSKIAIEINERLNGRDTRCKVRFMSSSFAECFDSPLSQVSEQLHHAWKIGLDTSDVYYGGLALCVGVLTRFAHGHHAQEAIEGAYRVVKYAEEHSILDQVHIGNIELRYWQLLQSYADDPSKFQFFNEEFKSLDLTPTTRKFYHEALADLYLRLGDYEKSFIECEKVVPLLPSCLGLVDNGLHFFNHFMASVHTLRSCSFGETFRRRRIMRQCFKNVAKRAKAYQPNFQHMLDVMVAEYAVLSKDFIRAIAYYEKAFKRAEAEGFNGLAALASQRMADLCIALGHSAHAAKHIDDAIQYYAKLGAPRLVDAIKVMYSSHVKASRNLFWQYNTSGTPSFPMGAAGTTSPGKGENIRSTIRGRDTNIQMGSETVRDSLDIQYVVKSASTLSQEVVVAKLLDRMIRIIAESSSANLVHLLLNLRDSKTFLVEATRSPNGSVEVVNGRAFDDSFLLASVVNGVIRSRNECIIADAATDSHFSNDPYVLAHGTKSVLCLPILRQDEIIGILYLENTHTTDAFTVQRTELLFILSAQISISIQNAYLYQNLEQKVTERTALLEEKGKDIRNMLENMKQGVFTIDAEGKIYPEYSRHLEAILGKTALSGKDMGYLLFSNSDVTAEVQSQMKSIISASIGSRSSTFFVNSHLLVKEFCRNLGELKKHLEIDWDPLIGKDDKIDAIMVTLRDVTEFRNLQLRAAEVDRLQLVLAKEESIKVLVGGVAHEFNNPLAIILMSLESMQRNFKGVQDLSPGIHRNFNMMEKAIDRISSLNAKLLELAELQGTGEMKTSVKLSALIQTMSKEQMDVEILPQGSSLDDYREFHLAPEQFQRLMHTIVDNARDALQLIPEGQRRPLRTIITCYVDHIHIDILDWGVGVEESNVPLLFSPFFTTKEIGNGMGINLFFAREYARYMGGDLELVNPCQPTQFRITLPAILAEKTLVA